MDLNLEVGKYYVGMDGAVQEINSGDGVASDYPFVSKQGRMFHPNGAWARRIAQEPRNLLFECDRDGWVKWEGQGECPIPWAKAGEWEAELSDGLVETDTSDASECVWSHDNLGDIIAFRLIPKEEAPATKERRRDTITLPGSALRELIGAAKDAQVLLERSGDESANRCVRALDEAINQARKK